MQKCDVKECTVGAQIPNIRIPNPFENQTFQSSVFEWFCFQMFGTIDINHRTDHSKTELFKIAALA